MRLIDAKRLVEKDEIVLVDKTKIWDEPYAILSHTWGRQLEESDGICTWGGEDDEILFADVRLAGVNDQNINPRGEKPDARNKILKASEAAQAHGCDYLWVDTCCFNKESSAELDESINAMFSWYRDSKLCLVYLADLEADSVQGHGEEQLRKCRWFRRGWTLQELIAPEKVEFYNQKWNNIGSRTDLVEILKTITRINGDALSGEKSCSSFTVAQKMKWAARRETKRPEDRAYSLLGLFGVHMSLIYGVGEKAAFRRLQVEIIQNTTDMTVFAWSPDKSPRETAHKSSPFCSMLADSPDQFEISFEESPEMMSMTSMELDGHFSITNKGVLLDASTLRIVPKDKQASKPALVLLIGYLDQPNHVICYGFYLQKIGSANYARYGEYGLAQFVEDKTCYKLKPVPRHQCYITISPEDVALVLRNSHRKAIVVPEGFTQQSSSDFSWRVEVKDRVPERIWDYQNGLFFRDTYGLRDVVRAVSMVLQLLGQEFRFAVLVHRVGDKDKVFILDGKHALWSDVKHIFGPSQRFGSVKWDDLTIDPAIQSEYLDVVAQGRSYRVSASLETLHDTKTKLRLDVAPDADQQIRMLEKRLKDVEKLVMENGTRISNDGESTEGDASRKRPRNQ